MAIRNIVGSHNIDIFVAMDKDLNSHISYEEFAKMYRTVKPKATEEEMEKDFMTGDTNKDK